MSLLFTLEHAEWILYSSPHTGEPKTETRRLWRRWQVKVGGIYYAQTRMFDSKSQFARIKVTDRWLEYLNVMTDEGVWREGFVKREDYLAVLAKVNGIAIDKLDVEQTVYVIRFEVVQPLFEGLKE